MSGKVAGFLRNAEKPARIETGRYPMSDIRVPPGKTTTVGDVSVENKTSNSITVRYDRQRKTVLLVDCCLEEQGK